MSFPDALTQALRQLPIVQADGRPHLAYQTVTDLVAVHLFPDTPPDAIDAAAYQRILETAAELCQSLGYGETVKLTPPAVPLTEAGLYWTTAAVAPEEEAPVLIIAGPTAGEMLAEGSLLDARLSQLGVEEVSRQHFNIPVTASDAVIDLMRQAVASGWPNDFKGIWHDILGMCIKAGEDVSPTERRFTVIIRGVGQRRYWRFAARLETDGDGLPYLSIHLVNEPPEANSGFLFGLGRCLVTPGVEALNIDVHPFLALHAEGKWGDLDAFDVRQNNLAVKQGGRILSAYDAPLPTAKQPVSGLSPKRIARPRPFYSARNIDIEENLP
jgi:hypothetical protein